jgi:hypothetical protein
MPNTGIAKLFRNGGSQVRVRRVAEGVLLEPLIADPAQWFAERA